MFYWGHVAVTWYRRTRRAFVFKGHDPQTLCSFSDSSYDAYAATKLFRRIFILSFISFQQARGLSPVPPQSPGSLVANFASMARHPTHLLLCVICLACAISVASAQSTSHHKPRDPPLGSRSKFNPETKHFEPVGTK
jgi:hypothetical protein